MKALALVALFALVALVNCQPAAIFCNFTDTACTNIAFCTGITFGQCHCTSQTAPTTNPYFSVTGNTSTGGNVLVYASSTACFTSAAPVTNTTWFTLGGCVAQTGYSYKVMANTTAVWQLAYIYYSNTSGVCTIPGPAGSVTNVGTGFCAASNCTSSTYTSSITAGCSFTRQSLPSNYIYGIQSYTDSNCTNLNSISGGTGQSTCIQISATNSSGPASITCSTTQIVTNNYNTTGNCTGPIGSTTVVNGSCSFNGAYYTTITCGSASGTTTGATTTSATTTGTTTGASTSTGGTTATTTNSASPVFIHLGVIVLSVLVLLGLFF